MRVAFWQLAVILVFTPLFVQAQTTNSWSNSASGKWETAGNWSAGAPSSSHSANLITNATTKVITLDATTVASGTMTISNLVLSGPAGTINTVQLTNTTATALRMVRSLTLRSGGALYVTNSTVQVDASVSARTNILDGVTTVAAGGVVSIASNSTTFVGSTNGATGIININGGTMTIANLRVALATNSTGLITINRGALFVTNVSTIVGGPGNGQILVTNGVFTTRAVTVGQGAGGAGMLTVTGGSTNNCGFLLAVAQGVGATGSVWVTGGSMLTNSGNIIGTQGVGTLDLTNSTAVLGGLTVGSQAGSHGIATFVGSTVKVNGMFIIGSSPEATGAVKVISTQLDSTNNITLVGDAGDGRLLASNATIRTSTLYVAVVAGGTLTLLNSDASVLGNAFIGVVGGSTGTVWVTGGTLALTNNDAFLAYSGVGRMTLSNGTLLAGKLLVGAIVDGQGTLTIEGGTASIYSNLVIGDCVSNGIGQVILSSGILAVTNPTQNAVLDIRNGTLTLSAGTLLVDKFVMTNSCGFFTHTGGTLVYGTAVLSSNRDDDADGILNGYEQSHGLDPLDPADAAIDSDGDGFTNLQEFLAGTDATNSVSALRILSVTRQSTNVVIAWATTGGKTNAVQATGGSAGSFSTNGFVDITLPPHIILTGSGDATTNFVDVGGATNTPSRFYRVRLVP